MAAATLKLSEGTVANCNNKNKQESTLGFGWTQLSSISRLMSSTSSINERMTSFVQTLHILSKPSENKMQNTHTKKDSLARVLTFKVL